MPREIFVTIGTEGASVKTKIETRGFEGGECEKVTSELEKSLGPRKSNVRTAEFHKTSAATVKQR
jgi:hypothetical protein